MRTLDDYTFQMMKDEDVRAEVEFPVSTPAEEVDAFLDNSMNAGFTIRVIDRETGTPVLRMSGITGRHTYETIGAI